MFGWSKKRKKELVAQFNELVRPELVEAMKSPDFHPPLNRLIKRPINFLIVAVAGSSPDDMGRNLGVVAETAQAAGWWADYLFSNIAVLANGVVLRENPPPLSRSDLLANIVAALGADCKSLGGDQSVLWGDYGNSNRRVYGPFFPDFLALVSRLHQQPFGEHVDSNAH